MAQAPLPAYGLDDILSARAKDALRSLELNARRAVEGALHGVHRSRRKGISTEFDHHKQYQPGDPLKHLDWKVSARHDRYFVKRYLEDTALTLHIVVDRSASMRRASGGATKFLQAARIAAGLVYLALRQGDSAGLALSDAGETVWVTPGSTQAHLVRVLQALAAREAGALDQLPVTLQQILDRARRKGLVALVSDLMFDPAPVQRALASLQAQGHEVLLFQLRDPAEEDFPFNRWVQFQDLEDPARRHRLDTIPLKRLYREEYAALQREWREWARKYNVHLVSSRTDEPVETVLTSYIRRRVEPRGS
ncbi:MAG: DUF58 domain-containing protein [Planctomycetota bacterium]|nr:DUF58 domain-containing protein [Planctomycetota bacterium]